MRLELVDRAVLQQWSELDPESWRQTAIEVIDAALIMIERDLNALRSAEASPKAREAADLAHRLKSTCASVGIREGVALFKDIEAMGDRLDANLLPQIQRGISLLKDALPALQAYRADLERAMKVSA